VGGPLKDALSFAWTIDGEAAGIGATMAHTFAQDGAYQVRLIVADHFGLADTTTTEVRVANVLPTVASFDGAILYAGETYRATGGFADPGADTWTASVSYAGTSQALALQGKTFALAHTYATAGTYTATVSVRDDQGTGTGLAQVEVRTALRGVDDLSSQLSSLGAGARTASASTGGSLDRGEINSLQLKLDAATGQLKGGNGGAAANILNAFVEQLQEFVAARRLTQARVDPLVTLARRVAASAAR
jgi:PKD repeat protein